MVNIIVFGASGFIGKAIVNTALDKGHRVTAVLRNIENYPIKHDNLKVVQGDILDSSSVENVLKGDITHVLSSIGGPVANIPPETNVRVKGIQNIISGMKNNGIKRILAVGGAGLLPGNEKNFFFEQSDFPQGIVPVSKVHKLVYEALVASKLDYTFICPPSISDGQIGTYEISVNTRVGHYAVTVGDLADFIVKEAVEQKHVEQRVGVFNTK
ncbi:unnamed protein product [Didymodactylos carnosus]|uniref:NAD(P)-binding domain-containing protein n=1 Tax=Didymodactylos carnosus TaxID=1234261 RepID=A0A8S2HU69_9BILA|nr:unnamed protein product [Didymodactylos carnosus]CAF3678892.1 unnamed protein product [Didymodactylos carnosus]